VVRKSGALIQAMHGVMRVHRCFGLQKGVRNHPQMPADLFAVGSGENKEKPGSLPYPFPFCYLPYLFTTLTEIIMH
jgi:hypothetical protein